MESSESQGRLTRRDLWIALALGVATMFATAATSGFYGMTWDEGYYYPTFEDVVAWVGLLFSSPGLALSATGIEAGWGQIEELPPLTKWIGALCVALTPAGWELEAVRSYAFVLFGATVAMLFAAARRRASMPFALAAALLYAMHPRIFAHGHFAASEVVFAFLATATLLVADGRVAEWRRGLLLAALCGLAIATKVNGIILTAAVCGWLCVRPWLGTADERQGAAAIKGHARSLALVALVAPLLALAIWPWMWSNTAAHLMGYWVFIRDHAYQGVWYLGSKWNMPITPGAEAPLAPWHYPIVMLVVATPPLTVLAALAGVLWTVWRLVSQRGRAPAADVLALLMVIGPLAAASLPGTPKYDGERLFFPAFAPLLLLVARLDVFHGDPDAPASWRRWRVAIPAVLLAATAFSLATHGHRGLLYTNEAIRAVVPRGEDFPFEVSYWQETITPAVVDDIMQLSGTDTVRVKTLALHDQVFDVQRRWGRLPAGFVTGGPPPYDYHLVQNRRGFWMRSEWSLRLMREPLLQWPPDAREPALYLFDGAPPLPLPEETVRLLEQR